MGIVLHRWEGAARLGLAALGTVIVSAVAAVAWFTASGVVNAAGTVGDASGWSVTGADGNGNPSSTGLMYPGAAAADFTYRVTNTGRGYQGVEHVTVTFATGTDVDGHVVVVDSGTGNPIRGCLAGWFTVGTSAFTDHANAATTLPLDMAGGDYLTGSTPVAMADAGAGQSACEGARPRLTVTAG